MTSPSDKAQIEAYLRGIFGPNVEITEVTPEQFEAISNGADPDTTLGYKPTFNITDGDVGQFEVAEDEVVVSNDGPSYEELQFRLDDFLQLAEGANTDHVIVSLLEAVAEVIADSTQDVEDPVQRATEKARATVAALALLPKLVSDKIGELAD